MTKKQNQILEAAILLFAKEGYHATSTSKVAKHANVSEGLIFKHYTNKEGLLDGILRETEERFKKMFANILAKEDSKEIIQQTLETPFNISESELDFWKLLFKLKWELGDKKIKPFEPLKLQLTRAFDKLRYRNPKLETEFLIQHLNGLMGSIINNQIADKRETKEFLLRKYHL